MECAGWCGKEVSRAFLDKPFENFYYPKGKVIIIDGEEYHDEERIDGNTVDKD